MSAPADPAARRARVGAILIALGILTIVAAGLGMLEASNGPGLGPTEFAQRRSYNQTKEAMHEVFPLGLACAAAGLGLAMLGGRLRRGAQPDSSSEGRLH